MYKRKGLFVIITFFNDPHELNRCYGKRDCAYEQNKTKKKEINRNLQKQNHDST